MDNTGLYTTIAALLIELGNSGDAEKNKLILSNKTPTSLPEHTFDFVTNGDDPQVLDYLVQGDFYTIITNVAGNTITVVDGTNIANGLATGIRTDYTDEELLKFITDSMAFIDRHTRQWFNARTFDINSQVKLEGNNSGVLFMPVPIISIDRIYKGKDGDDIPLEDLTIFQSRTLPDDRRNPMIKLGRFDGDIYSESYGLWNRGQLIYIQGTFGFLEEDGSTPSLVSRATLKLSIKYALETLGESAASSLSTGNTGAIKKEKTDLHEIEYYDASGGGSGGQNDGTGLSGDDEIDDIIAAYRSPIIVAGSFPDIGVERPRLQSWTTSHENQTTGY